ncbi:MAG: hypothetical protein R2830_15690 [Saprospiraceae bacterium]
MLKRTIFSLYVAATLVACGNDQPADTSNTKPVSADQNTTGSSMSELKSKALQEDDIYGRVSNSLGTLQREYEATVNQPPNVGETGVYVDDKLNIVIKNEKGGDTYETIFNMKDLSAEDGGLSLIADKLPGEFPGLRIQVLEGREGVKKYKNHQLIAEERALEIYMPHRENIERIVPAIVAALNVAHGKN